MGKTRENKEMKPRKAGSFPSPSSSSSSSSDFEFTVSLSPSSRKSSHLCPADELFYKGQLLPLHPSPRISMVRTLFLASSSTSSSSSTCTSTTASRDSNGSNSSSLPSSECNSSRPSSATEEEEITKAINSASTNCKQRNNYFSSFANRLSSKFLSRGGSKKDTTTTFGLDLDCQIPALLPPPTSEKKTSSFAKQVLKKYVKKVKPFYDKLSSKNQNQNIQSPNKKKTLFSFPVRKEKDVMGSIKKLDEGENPGDSAGINEIYPPHSQSFSGNLRFPRRKRCAGSCPSSMRSSPTHSGLLNIGSAGGFPLDHSTLASSSTSSTSSSMDELHSAIQGAIAHCKSTMIQSNQEKALDLSSPATSVN